MSVVVVAVFSPLEGRRPELRAALRAGIAAAHAERGCLLYAIHDADDGTIVMIEKWESRADLDAHAEGAAIDGLRRDVSRGDRGTGPPAPHHDLNEASRRRVEISAVVYALT